MGFEVSRKTANKIRSLVARGRETDAAEINGLGTDRYDTHITITGAASSGGYYPCVATTFDPITETVVDYTAACWAVGLNGEELVEGVRYSALNCGKLGDTLLFETVGVVAGACLALDESGGGIGFDTSPDPELEQTITIWGQAVVEGGGCGFVLTQDWHEYKIERNTCGVLVNFEETDTGTEETPISTNCCCEESCDSAWYCDGETCSYRSTCGDNEGYFGPFDTQEDCEDYCTYHCSGWYCCQATGEVIFFDNCDDAVNFVCESSSESGSGSGSGSDDGRCGGCVWVWYHDEWVLFAPFNYCGEGCTCPAPTDPPEVITGKNFAITYCSPDVMGLGEGEGGAGASMLIGPYDTEDEALDACGSSSSSGSDESSSEGPCEWSGPGWYCTLESVDGPPEGPAECFPDAGCGTQTWVWDDNEDGNYRWYPTTTTCDDPDCGPARPPTTSGTPGQTAHTNCCSYAVYGCYYFDECNEWLDSPLIVIHGPYDTEEECGEQCPLILEDDDSSSGSSDDGCDAANWHGEGWYCCDVGCAYLFDCTQMAGQHCIGPFATAETCNEACTGGICNGVCTWTWNGSAWTQTSSTCEGGCFCIHPIMAGRFMADNTATACTEVDPGGV